jgi:hypothetical protein
VTRPHGTQKHQPRTFAEADEIDRFLNDMADIFEDKHEPWRAQAACRGDERPTWLWFSARGDTVTQDKARRICESCFVQAECLAYAESRRQRVGMWAGLSMHAHLRKAPRTVSSTPVPCRRCGQPFVRQAPNELLCSDRCRRQGRKARQAANRLRAS